MSHAQRGPLAAFAVLALASATTVGTLMASADGGATASAPDSDQEILIQARVAAGPAPVTFGQRLLLGGGLPGQASASTDASSDGSAGQREARAGDANPTKRKRSRVVQTATSSTGKSRKADGREGFDSKTSEVSVDLRGEDGPRSEQQTGGVPPGDAGEPGSGSKPPSKDDGNPSVRPDPGPATPVPPSPQTPGDRPENAPGSTPPTHESGHSHDRGDVRPNPKDKARSRDSHGKAPRVAEKRHEAKGAPGKRHAKKRSAAAKKHSGGGSRGKR